MAATTASKQSPPDPYEGKKTKLKGEGIKKIVRGKKKKEGCVTVARIEAAARQARFMADLRGFWLEGEW